MSITISTSVSPAVRAAGACRLAASALARRAAITCALAASALALSSAGAWGATTTPGTGWEAFQSVAPTNLAPGGSGTIQVDILNTGAARSSGSITVTDVLPPGVTATKAGGMASFAAEILSPQEEQGLAYGGARWSCSGTTVVTCTSDPAFLPAVPVLLTPLGEVQIVERIGIAVNVAPGASGVSANRVTIAGGGASSVTNFSGPVTVSPAPAGFGLSGFDVLFTNADGTVDTQAGSHPYAATVAFGLNELADTKPAGGEVRNLEAALPPGLFGDPTAVPRCTRAQLDGQQCPPQTQVGIDQAGRVDTSAGGPAGFEVLSVYNMVPPPGVPAEFAFSVAGFHAFLDAEVRNGGGYGLVERITNVPPANIDANILTLWGVPADPSHDAQRFTPDLPGSEYGCSQGCASGIPRKPLLTLPTSCGGPQQFTFRAQATYTDPSLTSEASVLTHDANGTPAGFTGCEGLSVEPSLSVVPDTSFADTAAGLSVDLHVPQETLSVVDGLVSATLKNATVTLPEGLVANPGVATGLSACQEAQADLQGAGPASCPASSRVGSVRVNTPLLAGDAESELEGGVYVLQSNPPDLRLLIAPSGDGVNLKLVAKVHLDAASGRLTTTLSEAPELPFSDFKLTFNGGPQAALITPRACGVFTTSTDFTPWSTPFTADVSPFAQFAVDHGAGGGACPAGEPFAPSMTAGMVNNQAGAFSPLSVTFNRQDSEQDVSGLSVTAPPGLLAMLKSVERCGEPQATQGTCGAGSLIGHTTVAVGAGPDPLYVQGGQVFLTGPYKGAPFGLSVVVPAIAGPFNLGNVIVRAAISIDPHTAQPTISSDPLPTILDGVPLQVKLVNVTVDRPGFTFNPTDCEPLTVGGSVTSTQGASAPVSSRFQAANCAALAFKPSFTVSTQAKTSKKNGASLDVKVRYPAGAQANIHSVAVTLPKQLPARLTTLQQACPEAVFAANPAACPAASDVGSASASTPVLAGALTGPAYLVSHGGAAFPDLVVVLQGEGVTLDLVGNTNIKKSVTTSTFATVPDAPISSFELKLPTGAHSALTATLPAKARGSLCGQALTMPTTLTGQNGAVVKQSTRITVTGCAKPKKRAKRKHKSKSTKHGKR